MPIVIQWPLILVMLIACSYRVEVESKVFERCELARLLLQRHHLEVGEVAQWVCIANHSSGFNTAAVAKSSKGGSHGLFQISDVYWCSPPGEGAGCNLACQQLKDDDISDDLSCIKRIYDEHERISGDGYTAWKAYEQHCKHTAASYIQDCFPPQLKESAKASATKAGKKYRGQFSGNSIQDYEPEKDGKVYGRCELARELHDKHEMPMQQIPTWVCIAEHESRFNTAAVGRLNADGSADHGLFQISDLFWCSHDRYSGGGKACGLPCSKLLDNDITDDVQCIKKIHSEHTALSGDGFSAWTVYQPHCQNQSHEQIANCFQNTQPQFKKDAYDKNNSFFQHANGIPTKNKNNPFLKQIPGKTHYSPPAYNEISKSPAYNGASHEGKAYTRCSLAQELYFKHNFPIQDISTWVCIAEHASNFNTSAVEHSNPDGSADHGLFKISDRYWCDHTGNGGKACNLPCNKLLDADLKDDVACIKAIHQEHNRLSGDGFNAWPVYKSHCKNQAVQHIKNCFDEETLESIAAKLPSSTLYAKVAKDKGKTYKKCELAQELYRKHHIPLDQISKWVCIAQHESSFNTAAVGRLNTDGSADHGLFQISDLYWCSHDHYSGKACNIPCDKLLDSDITDDVKCIKIIYEEHTRISGDGFDAWTVYQPHCRQAEKEHIRECFTEQDFEHAPKQTPSSSSSNSLIPRRSKSLQQGKVYKKCELAQELLTKQRIPMEEVATWVCIAEHVSSYNTAAVGHLSTDGSLNHGIFQISDLYWCSQGQGGGKACNIPCERLLDSDITDDIRCIKIIYDEHARLSGNGFDAWPVYKTHCQNQKISTISSCFSPNQLTKLEKQHGFVREPKNTPLPQEKFHYSHNPFLRVEQKPLKVSHFKLDSADKKSKYSSNLFLQNFIAASESEAHESIIGHAPYNHITNTKLNNQEQNTSSKSTSGKEQYQITDTDYTHNPFLSAARNKSKSQPVEITREASSFENNPFLGRIKISSTEKPGKYFALPTVSSKENFKNYLNSNEFRGTTTTTPQPKTTSARPPPTTARTTTKIPANTATKTTAATTEKPISRKLTALANITTHKPAPNISTKRVPDTQKTNLVKTTTTGWSWLNERHSTKLPTTTTKPQTTTTRSTTTKLAKNTNLKQVQNNHYQSFTTLKPLRNPGGITLKNEKSSLSWSTEQKSTTAKPLTTSTTENWRKWDKTTTATLYATTWNARNALKSSTTKPFTTIENGKKWIKVKTEKHNNGKIKIDLTTPKPSSTTRKPPLTTTENWRKLNKSLTKSISNSPNWGNKQKGNTTKPATATNDWRKWDKTTTKPPSNHSNTKTTTKFPTSTDIWRKWDKVTTERPKAATTSSHERTTWNWKNEQKSSTTKPLTSSDNWRKWDKATATTTRKNLQSTTNNWRSTTTAKPSTAKTTKSTTTTAKPTRLENYKISTTKRSVKATTLPPRTGPTKPVSHKILVTTATKKSPSISKVNEQFKQSSLYQDFKNSTSNKTKTIGAYNFENSKLTTTTKRPRL